MEHRHLLPKPGSHQPQQLGRQGDFRHQEDGAFAPLQILHDQANVDRGLAGPRHAIQQRHSRVILPGLAQKALEAVLLLCAEHQGFLYLGRFDLPAAQHFPFGQYHIAQLLQAAHRLGRGSRIIQDILHAGSAHAAQQLQNAALHGGSVWAAHGKGHSLLGRDCQRRDFFRLVPGLLQKLRLGRDPFFPGQKAQHIRPFLAIRDHRAEGRIPAPTAQIPHGFQHFPCPLLADGSGLPASVLGQRKRILLSEPKSRREHGPGPVIKRAKVSLPQEGRQTQLGFAEQRLLVQAAFHGLELFLRAGSHRNYDALRRHIAPSEGDLDPLAGLQGHILRDAVGIELINGIACRRNGNSCNHIPASCSRRYALRKLRWNRQEPAVSSRRFVQSFRKSLIFILFLDGGAELSVGDLLDGHGHRLLRQVLMEFLRLCGDLAGPMGN